MATKFLLLCFFINLIINIPSFSQTIDADFKKKASEYYTNSDWDNAITMYSQIIASEQKNMQAWHRLSASYINKKDYDKALEILEAGSLNGDHYVMLYNMSSLYARKGLKEKSLEALRKAIKSGYQNSEAAMGNELFSSLLEDKDFLVLIEDMRKIEFPCRYNERLKEFEFWVGEWDVYDINGNKAGVNKIEKILHDCVIYETWTNSQGRVGKSFTTINSNTNNWEQTWVDDQAGVIEFRNGKYENNKLSMIAEGLDQENKKQFQRMTFFKKDDGTVRQLGETSGDGIEWQTIYDLTYKKRN
jgi:tetratricopeptide (TPR) repeat protein